MTDKSTIRILIADDDEEDIELLEEAVLQESPKVQFLKFLNGRSIQEYLYNAGNIEYPCLIILDYNMPELTGAEVLSWMKDQGRYTSIPTIVLSTSNSPMYIDECMKNGALEYIVKPDNLQQLNALAKKLVTLCTSARI